ncbi:MAG: PEP-utilizing enzyme [Bacteriovorax sp.]|nr:PEP-utilizing enzyme [Bacteriovorax sp.]
MNNTKTLGIPVSPGKAFGKVFILKGLNEDEELIVPHYISSFDLEQARLGQAIQSSKLKLNQLIGISKIFKTYLIGLEDPELLKQALTKIRNESVNAEWALKKIAAQFIAGTEPRASIISDVISNLIYILLKNKTKPTNTLTEPAIIVARDLNFIQVALMNPKNILGFLTELGGISTQAAIIARGLKIPAIVGLENITSRIKAGDQIFFDGDAGTIIINPSRDQLQNFNER